MISRLKKSIELKFGKKITYQKDCNELSARVMGETGELLSSSTLRRFFGFLSTNSQPARATLDILSAYCGFSNWESFKKMNTETEGIHSSSIDLWEVAKEKAKVSSINYCEQVKKTTPIGYNCTVLRSFSISRFNHFLNSSFSAMPFIAPGGYGKSITLVMWYENVLKSRQNPNDIILIIPAIIVEAGLGRDRFLDDFFESFLGVGSSDGFFDFFLANPGIVPGKLLVIIDALDEVSLLGYKAERLFSALHTFIAKYSSCSWFKLVVASRFSAWESFYTADAQPSKWCFSDKSLFTSEGANIPPLNDDEIQQILDNTINNLLNERLLVEEFSYDMLQIVSYPYFLQVFIEIYSKDLPKMVLGRIELLTQFIKNKISQGSCSEEKADIVRKIVEFSVNNNCYTGIKKAEIKGIYPIHLKHSGNYYNAYNELLSFGVIHEETIETIPGVYTKYVTIPQGQLFDLLIVQEIILKSGGVTFAHFERIQSQFQSSAQLPNVIATLFELAYKQRNVQALKPFFSLRETTIEKTLALPAIHYCLRNDDYMSTELIPAWSQYPLARKHYFERLFDINSLVKSHRFTVQTYMQNVNTEFVNFMGTTLLALSDILSLNLFRIDEIGLAKNLSEVPSNSNKQIVGLWFSCKLFTSFINQNHSSENILKDINTYTSNYQIKWEYTEKLDFELALSLGLLFVKNFKNITERLDFLSNWQKSSSLLPTEKALIILYEYSSWFLSGEFSPSKMELIKSFFNELPIWNGFYALILAKAWFAVYSLHQGNLEKALDFYRKAVEISNISGYLIFEVKLLKNLIPYLEQLGETQRASECKSLANSILEKKGVDISIV